MYYDGVVLSDEKVFGTINERGYKYLGVLEGADIIYAELRRCR